MHGCRQLAGHTQPAWLLLCRMLYTQHSGKQTLAIIYFVPVSAGVTRLFTKICFRSGDGKGTRGSVLINRLAKLAESSGLLHVFGGGIVDQVQPPPPQTMPCPQGTPSQCAARRLHGTVRRLGAADPQDCMSVRRCCSNPSQEFLGYGTAKLGKLPWP